jgi:hypothetical protein
MTIGKCEAARENAPSRASRYDASLSLKSVIHPTVLFLSGFNLFRAINITVD